MTVKLMIGLNFISFRDISLWDVKRFRSEAIKSSFKIERLGNHIFEQSGKVRLADFPNVEFGILGVNNKIGIFDAYIRKGVNFKQSYKRLEIGWVAYNPYRVNVGSIGVRTEKQSHEFISPAYVVFSCKATLLPDFLYKLFKTEVFRRIINESTTGSVRQNLTLDILKLLNIPLPSLQVQTKLLKEYYIKVDGALQIGHQVKELRSQTTDLVINRLGIIKRDRVFAKKGLSFVRYKTISRWALSYLNNLNSYSFDEVDFEIVPIKQVLSLFEGGKTPSTSVKAYWNGTVCWASPKDFEGTELHDTQDKITETAISDGMKVHPMGTILGVFRSGILRHSFPITVTRIPTAINQDLKAMDVNPELIDKNFFIIYLRVFQNLILELSSKVGVTVESINSDEFLDVPIVLPPLKFQQDLAKEVAALDDIVQSKKLDAEDRIREALNEFEHSIFNI